jgi:hypothetical protein
MATSQLRARDRLMLGTLAAVTVTGQHNAMFDAFTLSRVQRWNSSTAFLVEVSGHKLESSPTRDFV